MTPVTPSQDKYRASYDVGKTVIYSSRTDPRFSYCLYVPETIGDGGEPPELVVAVHGTSRYSFLEYRDAFAEFGRWNNCMILCPLFPVDVCGDGERSGYKYMIEGEIRYDLLLLGMVSEIECRYDMSFDRFAVFGFSGGGHFAHRFAILHPEKLWAASIGAPGSVTLLDAERDWWVGIRNLETLFGKRPDFEAMKQIAVHMVVGDADLETWEITHKEGSSRWMPGANDAGRTRPGRLATLKASFEAQGIAVTLDVVPGVAHDRLRCVENTKSFFAEHLKANRKAGRVHARSTR